VTRTDYLSYYLDHPIGATRSLLQRCWRRTQNRWWDLRARLAGACNADTWDEARGRYIGYAHWRCGRARGHAVPHRFVNSTWMNGDDRTRYDPIPVRGRAEHVAAVYAAVPFRHLTGHRHLIAPLARQRRIDRDADAALARRLAERAATR